MTGVKELTLTGSQPMFPEANIMPVPQETGLLAAIERLAANPDVDVAKLEKIIDLQERILRHEAESAFNRAFSAMQPKIPTIIERAKTDKTTYAPFEDIIEAVRPILAEFGFSLSHQTEWPSAQTVKVIGILTHEGGHSRRSEFQAAADQTGSKNAIQALGSTVQYGKRYSTKDLLLIVTRDEPDNDGQSSEKFKAPPAPEGYEAWWGVMEGLALDGFKALSAAWNQSKEPLRKYVLANDKPKWEALRRQAMDVGKT